jgi:uridine kinase
MNCPSSTSLATLAIQQLLAKTISQRRARVLGIAGYPYTGKSHLARAVQAVWPSGNATLLPTESAVLPRRLRQTRGVDGCAPEGHNMKRLLTSATSLRSGQSITCNEYSWTSGDFGGTKHLRGVGTDGLLIIDGTVTAAPPILELCDLVIFLSPVEEPTWFPLACQRDISEREWGLAPARLQNVQKTTTSALLREIAGQPLCISIRVDPVSWTWFLPGCGLCDSVPGYGRAQAPVPVGGCNAR